MKKGRWLLNLTMGVAIVVVCTQLAEAQEEAAEDEDTNPRWLRILAVGDSPPFQQAMIEGVRTELPPPPGSIPPRQIRLGALESEDRPMRLRLRQATGRLLVKGLVAPLVSAPTGEAPRQWLRLELPEESTSVLGILFRRPARETWDDPAYLLLRDDLEAFPNGSARIVNASPYPARVAVGRQKFNLPSGKARVVPIRSAEVVEDLLLIVEVGNREVGWKRVYDSSLLQNQRERTNIVIYRADGVKKRRPAKVLVVRDQASIPAPPKGSGR